MNYIAQYLEWLNSINPTILTILIIWSVFWKGLALWESAKRREKWWFIIILIVNTTGILEIIYLIAKKTPKSKIKKRKAERIKKNSKKI